jgi:tetratricopeptide (TPR) repeat protein
MHRFILFTLPLACLVSACGTQAPPAGAPAGLPPIVLISVDTLRSDRLPFYGYDGVETPHLEALRRDSILYRHAYSAMPLTLPAHTTALTGLLPATHGVRDNSGYRFKAEEHPSFLPRQLAELGYTTGAAVSSFVLRGATGLAAGFDFYDDELPVGTATDLTGVERAGAETLRSTLDWLGTRDDPRFFLFFHIYEPHTPYTAPPPFSTRYSNGYDAEVAHADDLVGRLLDRLRELGYYDGALIVFMSDHGEGLGDHAYDAHGILLYREALQVPLVVKLPGGSRAGETIEAPAQLADIPATILDAIGHAESAPPTAGTSLLRALPRDRPLIAETLFPRIHFGWSELASVIAYPYQLIQGPAPELFDLENDPGQLDNLLARERPTYTRLRRSLENYDLTYEPPVPEESATQAKLEALGYLSRGAGASTDGPLLDPKSQLGVLDDLTEAALLNRNGDPAAAVTRLESILGAAQGTTDAWHLLGSAKMQLGDIDGALAAYERAMELSNGSPQIALAASAAFVLAKRYDEARVHAEIAVTEYEQARSVLALIALREGRLDEAEENAGRLVERGTGGVSPIITLSETYYEQNRTAEALAMSDRALEAAQEDPTSPTTRGMLLVRGKILARLERTVEARTAFETEIERFPGNLDAYTHLAYLHAVEGRGGDLARILQQMVETNPRPGAYVAAAQTLRTVGDERSATALLRQSLQRWPESTEIREALGG